MIHLWGKEKTPLIRAGFQNAGRRERIRTSDPLVPNQLRYQAALLAENEAHLTASAANRQYLLNDKCLFDDNPAKIHVMQ